MANDEISREKTWNIFHSCSSKRYFEKYGYTWFYCHEKDNRWPSTKAWCIIDLKEQIICRRYWQICKICGTKVRPRFPNHVIEKMVQCAVDSFLKRTGQKEIEELDGVVADRELNGRHHQERCGKCIKDGVRCC